MKKKQNSLSKKELHTVISYISSAAKNIENGANANPQTKNGNAKNGILKENSSYK